MVSKTFSYIWKVFGLISAVFIVLVYVFSDVIAKLITSVLGVSSEVFVVDCLIALATIGIVASVIIFIIVSRQTKKEILEVLRFFPEHWETYKKLMESQSLNSPQNKEITLCSDRIKSAIAKAHELHLPRRAITPKIKTISNEMSKLGNDVLQRFPDARRYKTIGEKDDIQRLIKCGDAICKELEKVICSVEQTSKWFYS